MDINHVLIDSRYTQNKIHIFLGLRCKFIQKNLKYRQKLYGMEQKINNQALDFFR